MYSGEKTVEELKREWKKTKKEEIGVMYVNKLNKNIAIKLLGSFIVSAK